MNQKLKKRMIVPAVCLSILASAPGNIFAAKFDDVNIHWAKDAIAIWADHEVIQGADGLFRPDDTITRAEMAVMIQRIMNYQEKAENTFEDLPESWYTDAILRLVKHGVMKGHDGRIRPEDEVTREEALVMIARALGVEESQTRSASFADSDHISDWAIGAISAMAEKGFINGYEDGTFRPQENMTRACSVTVVNNSIKGFYNKPGTYRADEVIDGFVIVNSPDVILEGMTINGDLIVTPGVQDGKVVLQGSTVSGQQIVMGGSVESKPGPSNPDDGAGDGSDDTNGGSDTDTGGNGGGSDSGSGGSGGSGGGIQSAASTDIIVSPDYAEETGKITVGGKRYTIGENAFGALEAAVSKAQTLQRKAQITLMSDLQLEQTVTVSFDDLTLDGNGHTLTFGQGVKDGIVVGQGQGVVIRDLHVQMNDTPDQWNGSYGIQAYLSDVTLKNVSVAGADAAILVNGATVTLSGIVDVGGNEFGGIEVSKGVGVEEMPRLVGTAENLKNDTELTSGKPTVWIDKVSELTSAVVDVPGLIEVPADGDQLYFFLSQNPADVTADVENQQQLEEALADADIAVIRIAQDMTIDKTLSVTRPVVIEGRDGVKTLTFENKDGLEFVNAEDVTVLNIKCEITGNEQGWQGIYALQAYGNSNVTLNNVTATGADGGVIVNGATVTLSGIVDVGGNEFGGIEVSKGVGVNTAPRLVGAAENLKNDTELTSGNPTVWIDKVSDLGEDVVAVTGLNKTTLAEKDQTYYFLGDIPAEDTVFVDTLAGLEAALAQEDVQVIYLVKDIASDKTLRASRAVSIKGYDGVKTLTFENKDGLELLNVKDVTISDVKLEVTGNEEGWQGLYALQVYGNSDVTLHNVTATGADGGILVNGATVTLSGTVDVGGNEFGGIEVSKGVDAITTPRLVGAAENLKNDTEALNKPTVWIDKVSELTNAVVAVSGLNETAAEKDQTHFYLGEVPVETTK